jgi:hypothetical protein
MATVCQKNGRLRISTGQICLPYKTLPNVLSHHLDQREQSHSAAGRLVYSTRECAIGAEPRNSSLLCVQIATTTRAQHPHGLSRSSHRHLPSQAQQEYRASPRRAKWNLPRVLYRARGQARICEHAVVALDQVKDYGLRARFTGMPQEFIPLATSGLR